MGNIWARSISATICFIILISSVIVQSEESITKAANKSSEVLDDITTPRTTTTTDKYEIVGVGLDNSTLPIPPMYNKYELPTYSVEYKDNLEEDVLGVNVYVTLFIRSILDVDTKAEILTLDTDVGLQWRDAKIEKYLEDINYIDPVSKKRFKDKSLDADFLDQIWKPDVFIDEMVSSDNASLLGKLVTLKFYASQHLDPETNASLTWPGDFVYFARRTLKLRCGMEFRSYPADTQTCTYTLRSYSHQSESLWLEWAGGENPKIPPVYLNDPSDPNFDISLDSIEPSGKEPTESLLIKEEFNFHRRGEYSALRFTLKIRRKLSYHVVQTYVPSVLLVLITWLCFILPSSMIEARIGISMTTLLTLTAMFASVREQSPDVSYTMAIDIWMVFCIFEVFLALLLFTTIYWLRRRVENSVLRKKDASDSAELDPIETLEQTKEAYNGVTNFSQRYGFIVFALSFVAFFCGYWIYLLHGTGYLPDFKTNAMFNHLDEQSENTNKAYECYRKKFDSQIKKWVKHECDNEDISI